MSVRRKRKLGINSNTPTTDTNLVDMGGMVIPVAPPALAIILQVQLFVVGVVAVL